MGKKLARILRRKRKGPRKKEQEKERKDRKTEKGGGKRERERESEREIERRQGLLSSGLLLEERENRSGRIQSAVGMATSPAL